MPQRIDNAAVGVTVTAPGWVPILQHVNGVLTTVSLVLGILFLLWRWRRDARRTSAVMAAAATTTPAAMRSTDEDNDHGHREA